MTSPSPSPRFSLRKRLVALLAVLAVPAMAAPGDFGAMAGDAPTEGDISGTLVAEANTLPFEQPGMSFPGSAFYYLADPPAEALVALPASNPLERGAEAGREVGQWIDAGPAAQPFKSGQGGFSRAQQCLAQAVWYEAASESEAGQRAVAQVVLNRVAHPSWPSSVCGVVFEGSKRRTGCQFSFTCDGSLARPAKGATWQRARRIAGEALAGSVYAPIGHATHYHTLWVDPYWAGSLSHVGTIGAHRFYRARGAAGEKAAFTTRYQGEASASVTAPVAGTAEPQASDAPEASETIEAASATDETAPGASETPTTPAHNSSGQAREAYARSGQWKVDPTTLDLSPESPQPPRYEP